jgi:lipoprotein-anchoring transpeptidase ErfK/SrfK
MKKSYASISLFAVLAFLLLFAPTVLADTSYVVKPGDTLYKIAVQHGLTMQEIAEANGIWNYDHIEVGQLLVIPGIDVAPAVSSGATTYVVQRGDTLFRIAANHGLQTSTVAQANGITNFDRIYAGQTLTIPAGDNVPAANSQPQPVAPSPQPAPNYGARWIDVNLSTQTLTAYEGDVPVMTTAVSTGTYLYPTVTGQFSIYVRHQSQTMNGYLLGYDYYLPDVPYVMYFYRGFALHGTYWHNNFGTPMSHGCVNMPTDKAQWIYNWSDYGTLVNVHY